MAKLELEASNKFCYLTAVFAWYNDKSRSTQTEKNVTRAYIKKTIPATEREGGEMRGRRERERESERERGREREGEREKQ